MTRAVRTVLRKELVDHLRDRRSLLSAMLMPLLGPFTFLAMFTALAGQMRADKPLELPVVGRTHGPNLVAFLERSGAHVVDGPADPERAVRDGEMDLVLVIPEDYGKEFEAGRTASVDLVIDNSRNRTRTSVRRAQLLLQAYTRQLGSLRLLARGVSPQVAAPVQVAERDVATPERQAAQLLSMIPLFLLVAAFAGSMNVAIDATAGERERQSLEPLLLNPVPRLALATGKWLAAVVVAWAAILVCLVGFLGALSRVPLQDLGVRAHIDLRGVALILAAVLPLAPFAAAVQLLAALFSRSFKEAQTWLSLLLFLPMLPGMVVTFHPLKTTLGSMLVPALSQTLLVTDALRGEPVAAAHLLLAAGASLLWGLVCLGAMARLLSHEKIVFGR